MTSLANNPRSMTSAPVDDALLSLGRCALCWTCTRRSRKSDRAAALERVRFMLSIQPLDRQHIMLEAWLECDGVRIATVLGPISRPMALSVDGHFTHIDVESADGSCLLAMTLANGPHRVIYARSSLVVQSGLSGGTYDPPVLQHVSDERIAQSA